MNGPKQGISHQIGERLWEHECGCIEGVRPYRWYPCRTHRKRPLRALWGWLRR